MSLPNSIILNAVAGEVNQLIAGALIIAATAAYYALSSRDNAHEFPKLPGIQLYHAWSFYQGRYDFLQSNFKRSFGKSFSFNILHHNVIALSGEDARRVIHSADLNVSVEGVMILTGGVWTSPTGNRLPR